MKAKFRACKKNYIATLFHISGGDSPIYRLPRNRRRGRQFTKGKSFQQRLVSQKASGAGGSTNGVGQQSGANLCKLASNGPEQNTWTGGM